MHSINTTQLIGYAFGGSECRHTALARARARGRRFFDSAVAASVFHEGPCFGRGWLFLRFNVSAFILGYRMRARFCNARDLSFLASREYISRAEARVRFVICGALGRAGCAKNGNTARRYPFNNYEFFKRASRE